MLVLTKNILASKL